MADIDLQWFSAEEEGKTEEPSEYKLRKSRDEEGRVPKSQELNSNIIYLFNILLLLLMAPWIEHKLEEMMKYVYRNIFEISLTNAQMPYIFAKYFIQLSIPFAILGLVIGVVSNLIQNKGFIYTTKLITPKFDNIVPKIGKYLKRTLFSVEGSFNVVKSLLKVVVMVMIAFFVIRSNLQRIMSMLQTAGLHNALGAIGYMVAKLLVISAVFFLVIGIVDYFVQKKQFIENMKMTKQEVKEEYKELEGDPDVKNRLESAQRELLNRNMPKAVREADVLVTNPTHFAVALEWQRDKDYAPKITAKGEDLTAQNMKRIAREADVPIVENRPLARSLYTETEVGDIIPEKYIRIIATLYAKIGYMDRKK